MSLFVAALFIVLTPGILLRLPPGGSKLQVAVVHGLVFAVIYHFTHTAVKHMLYDEGFKGVMTAAERENARPSREGESKGRRSL